MRVTVPASTANLGPGFDAVALALSLPFVLSSEPDDELLVVEPTHPARVAFDRAGGSGELWWRSPIPPGRGLGFSGAARVAGAFLATEGDHAATLAVAAELEGHPENAAASLYGGLVVASGGAAVRVTLGLDAQVVTWSPDAETSTDKSRSRLPEAVPFVDAAFNVGRAALLVASLVAGDSAALRLATQDRLHQDVRLAAAPATQAALRAALDADPIAAWLSGSGPTVAVLVDPADAERVAAALPAGGHVRTLDVDLAGAVLGS